MKPPNISYKEITIQQLKAWNWSTERYEVYELPWYLKLYLYPTIWTIKGAVEAAIRQLERTK
ncbi:hypothetical protein LCGC14_1300550 [marine sediment metagenome]|uniref:Uncharacterized protein n=1 Tax=marine sediment metagenome TaxID=412755 RepID=A0A0F9NSN8_9ZZZZ